MALDQRLLDILACPKDKGPLYYLPKESALYNPRLQLRYEVRDDIPVMLIDEATHTDAAEHSRLTTLIEQEHVPPTFVAAT
ncbi:MAG: hypothetical protein JWL72_764 [Ilumatobacteraceae bacterium]|nr:hypothetical protein [Ilumatobacteraceae bacterium]MCU1400493.1 hypothetical protein [Acidimicrobiales bacterium]